MGRGSRDSVGLRDVLAKETKARGWWHAYGDVIPEGFDVYIGLEEAASQLATYEPDLVPGLLQTEDYARTLIRARQARRGRGGDRAESTPADSAPGTGTAAWGTA
jgi:Domain of unknown function (DUF5753)